MAARCTHLLSGGGAMKPISLRSVIAVLAFFLGSAALCQGLSFRIPTPFGELRGNVDPITLVLNPMSYLDPTGVPTASSLTEYAVRNPDKVLTLIQNPTDVVYAPVVSAIVAGRNAALVNGARRLPDQVKRALRGWYSDDILDSVRWSTEWNAVQNTLQAAQMWANKDTGAITLINVIVFRDAEGVDDVSLWAHELYHVKQYRDLGVPEFAKRWVNNSSVSGPIEAPAYEMQKNVKNALNAKATGPKYILQTNSECHEMNASVAYCDLWTANIESSVRFRVSGEAYATGHGNRDGHMQLIMIVDGKTCNSAASTGAGVNHATKISGPGYTCDVEVSRGQGKRVMLVAPNSRADATYTRATAYRLD